MQQLSPRDMMAVRGGALTGAELCGISLGLTWGMMLFGGPLIIVHAGATVVICALA